MRGHSDVPTETLLVILRSALQVTEDLVPLRNPSHVKIFRWTVCFLHPAVVVTQLNNRGRPGNTTAMNTRLGREDATHVPVALSASH